jgi:[glutamine synthetase] adenylyltransferase / [glutamine synthetase]-adenylyl-L-tyrosine phosphorylase
MINGWITNRTTLFPMPEPSPIITGLRAFSRYADRLLNGNAEHESKLLAVCDRPFSRTEMEDYVRAPLTQSPGDLKSCLRRLRQTVWLRCAARDLAGTADLSEVMTAMTTLAELSCAAAQTDAETELSQRYGVPIGSETGTAQQLMVVAMGKLGGRELNVSSDVDLIFVYPEEGNTDGQRSITNHEFFTLLGKRVIAALSEITDQGFVFRVDMRLRPYGDSGALAISLPALEAYFITQGRPWERYAWIKARPITGSRHADLAALVRPFVFRRYLDYGAVAQLRDLHSQIRNEVMRRDRFDDIKLGPGGIQVFQLIRGGREVRLQEHSTLATLGHLADLKLISPESAQALRESYIFLRNLEHRLQYMDDAQTQTLPASSEDQTRLANAMGFANYREFLTVLELRRGEVIRQFEAIFVLDEKQENAKSTALWRGELAETETLTLLSGLGFQDSAKVFDRLTAIRRGTRYQQLPEPSRARFDALAPVLIEMAGGLRHPDDTLIRTLDLLEGVSRRETYLALLLENQSALKKVSELASASGWAVKYLAQHPILLDELLDHRELGTVPDWAELKLTLREGCANATTDTERQWELLRHFKQAQVFRLIAQDIAGQLELEKLSDHLSDLADCILDVTVESAWATLKVKHTDNSRFAVIGYGKLGGKELGYGSDLDIIFLFDDDHAEAGENYARLAQRLNSWLNTYTASGVLYDTDLRLRPDGASGLLVSSAVAFRDYQLHHAWIWEHQALTRARFCAGDAAVGRGFEAIRIDVLCRERDLTKLREEVIGMRKKMFDGHRHSSEWFDVKQSRGGLVDIEFAVQYLVLAHAFRHRELTANVGNIALLARCGALGLIPDALAHEVATAYRELRRLQHRAWLDEQSDARFPLDIVEQHARPVRRLWQYLFDAPS